MTALDETYLFSSCSAYIPSTKGSSSEGNAIGTGCSRDKVGGGGARRLLWTTGERGRLLPVAMSLSDDEDRAYVDDAGDVRQAPCVRPGGYRFVIVGTSRRIPAFHGEDEDDLTDQPWFMIYVVGVIV